MDLAELGGSVQDQVGIVDEHGVALSRECLADHPPVTARVGTVFIQDTIRPWDSLHALQVTAGQHKCFGSDCLLDHRLSEPGRLFDSRRKTGGGSLNEKNLGWRGQDQREHWEKGPGRRDRFCWILYFPPAHAGSTAQVTRAECPTDLPQTIEKALPFPHGPEG